MILNYGRPPTYNKINENGDIFPRRDATELFDIVKKMPLNFALLVYSSFNMHAFGSLARVCSDDKQNA